jgi:hypothetical protein
VASLLLLLLAPIAEKFLPPKSIGIPLNTAVALALWLAGLAGLVAAIARLRNYRRLTLEVLDSRCKELIDSCASIREVYPQMIGPITANTYVPLSEATNHGDKAAMHKFRGRLFDFLNDAGSFNTPMKLRLSVPNQKSIGNLESVQRQLTEIHNRIQMSLF